MSARSIRRSHEREIADASRRNARRARRASLAAGAAIGATALFAPSALGASFEVNTLNDAAPHGSCSVAADGCTLRDAVDLANNNASSDADTITFADSLSGTILLTQGDLYLKDASGLSITDAGSNKVTISGGGDSRIFRIGNQGPVALTGLTLTGGYADSDGGGAILAYSGSSTTIVDSEISGNETRFGDGGGIRVRNGRLTLTNSKVTGNAAPGDDGGGNGGGIDAEKYSVLEITDSTISGNTAGYNGGGIFFDSYGNVPKPENLGSSITRSTISGNHVGGNGAGIEIYTLASDDSFAISRSTISGNEGSEGTYGGGIDFSYTVYGDASISDSTISGNAADFGGGISFQDNYYSGYDDKLAAGASNSDVIGKGGSVAIGNDTIASNTAGDQGGGIFLGGYHRVPSFARGADRVTTNTDSSSSTTTTPPPEESIDVSVPLISTIVADNTAASSPNDIDRGSQSDDGFALTNSLIETPGDAPFTQTPAGSSIIGSDPGLGALGNNGGPTQTQLPAKTSPAIDTGLVNGLPVDQRGLARTVDRDAPNGAGDGTDIGAVEIAGEPKPGEPIVVIPDQPPFNKVPNGCPILPAQAGKAFAGDDSAETIDGTSGNDILRGFGGSDTVSGEAGDDCLTGDDDADVINGNDGNDLGQGGKADDLMFGDAGNDRFGGGSGDDVIKLNNGDDKGVGGPGDDRVKGDNGDDLVRGRAGDDKVSGDKGNDDVKGGDDDDKVLGGPGSDKLHGGFGDDVVIGGTGKDKIDCGKGHDVAVASAEDTVSKDCETVRLVKH